MRRSILPVPFLRLAWTLTLLASCGAEPPVPQDAEVRSEEHSSWIPIELHRKLVLVPGRLHGTDVTVLVDSRSTQTLVSSHLIETLGLRPTGETQVTGVGGSEAAVRLEEVRLELGGWTLVDSTAFAFDLEPVSELAGRQFQVVLGDLAFANFVVDLDIPGRRLRLVEPAAHAHDCETGVTVPLVHTGRELQLEASLGDLPPTRFDIDTASTGALAIYPHYAAEHRILEGLERVSTAWGGGVGGGVISDMSTLPRVRLGTLTLTYVPASFARDPEARYTRSGGSANLGNAILARFRAIFDLSRGELHLHPGPDWNQPFSKERAGLAIVLRQEAAEVVHVSEGSPAAATGWRVGDRILTVDGERVGADYWDQLSKWTDRPAETRVELGMESGETRILTLAEYY